MPARLIHLVPALQLMIVVLEYLNYFFTCTFIVEAAIKVGEATRLRCHAWRGWVPLAPPPLSRLAHIGGRLIHPVNKP
jgi:hypothetical protein